MSLLRDLLYLLGEATKDAMERQPGLPDELAASMQAGKRNPGAPSLGEAFAMAFDMALRNGLDPAATRAEWREGLRASRVASVALDRITSKAGADRRAAAHAAEEGLIRAMTEHRRERRERDQGDDAP